MNIFHEMMLDISDVIWSYVLIALLIGLGLYFTVRTKFVQFRYFTEMFRLMGEKAEEKDGKKGVSAFQAFSISVASRVGTGNLAGVAIAIAAGGPGSVFWMWIIALIGAGSAFVESTLGQIYKVKDKEGFRGGPAYYMEKGLGKRWMGVIFAILISISYGLVFNAVQANTVGLALDNAYGVNRTVVGVVLAILTAVVIIGGVQRIAKMSSIIVPVMALIYIVVAMFVVLTNITLVPEVLESIFMNAFGFREAVAGGIGAAVMQGIKRGLFSNEAGMGSAPNAAATAHVSHPVKQGLIQTLGVFVDTLIICSATAFMILFSDVQNQGDLTGIELTQVALSQHIGSWATGFVAIAIFLFAFTSLIGNYYYGQTNLEFLKVSKTWMWVYRAAVIGMIMLGSVATIQIVWDMADLFMGFMAILNLLAIALLGKIAFAALKDYTRQKKQGLDPVFYAESIGVENTECWDKETKNVKRG
ncbi:alanine/glycine:cation symporter family protein [Priestia taiwanensis]|uniref:Sodium:alanine symporter n=1 Tax=Priestia taiwanensis TaxID=1347902 RepID=A0A917AK20_9BACI|nr:alanine/glycine:cation symporter family protein [Priestia taiwanensis]MBM7361862.1 AGCS family alanine or glycine:cation symporter [Priestia taiwanensis]GGE57518.1 sodium:alanine symporter [Priestia taiwanensis]